jgi:DNA-binding beta-propeller fold protein YncE
VGYTSTPASNSEFSSPPTEEGLVYVCSRGANPGIVAFHFDQASGKLTSLGVVAEIARPSFLAIHPNGRWLYAVGRWEMGGEQSDAVSAFSMEHPQTGKLTSLNRVQCGGSGPCFVTVDSAGKSCLIANYDSGSVAVFSVADDGTLGEMKAFFQHTGTGADPLRQNGPHAHSINLSLDNRFAIAADLGLDRVFVYQLDASQGSLTPNNPPYAAVAPGAGPCHFAFHPTGKFGYLVNELNSTVTAFAWECSPGCTSGISDRFHSATGFLQPEFRSRATGASLGQVPLHVNPVPRQHCRVSDRVRKRHARSCRVGLDGWQDAAKLRYQLGRHLSHCGQPGFGQHRCVSN